MRIYRWKKPELTVTLTTGGTLLDNTQYWVTGQFRSYNTLGGGYTIFYNGSGPHADAVTFTTDAVNKSIEVSWQTSGSITEISDAGSGEVLITTELHCLRDNDEITIMSGAYAGTYDITWVSYNSFKITATWGATDTPTWECYELPNDCQSISLWMHTKNPVNSDGTLNKETGRSQYVSHAWNYRAYTTNPIVVTAPFALARQQSDPFFSGYDASYGRMFETGMPIIVGTETSLSLDELNDEFKAAGLFPECHASSGDGSGSGTHLDFYGYIDFKNVTTTYQYLSVNVQWGSIRMDNAVFRDSAVLFRGNLFRSWCGFIARNTTLSVGYNSQFDIIPSDNDSTSFNPKQTVISLVPSTTHYDNVYIMNKNVVNCSYPRTGTITNSKFYGPYLYWVMDGRGDPPTYPPVGHRSISNTEIKLNRSSFDFTIYSYGVGYYYVQNFENIDTDRELNIKKAYMNTTNSDIDVVFWRTGNIYLVDDIDGANINIVGSGYTYDFTSSSGVTAFDVREQMSYPRYNIYNDNVIENFVITVTKDGYENYTTTVPLGQDLVDLYIELAPAVKTRQDIEGNVYLAMKPETGSNSKLLKL